MDWETVETKGMNSMSQIASLTAANAVAHFTLPLIQTSFLPQNQGQPQAPSAS